MSMNEAAIVVKNLKESYKGMTVLKGVDFFVKPGRVFALLGSNGAGKTTTVRILSTLLDFDEGQAEIHGFDVAKQAKQVRAKISLTGHFCWDSVRRAARSAGSYL